jgi:hypothetical protein
MPKSAQPVEKTDITELEQAIVAKVATANFPPATASKRFIGDLSAGYIKQLSDKGRMFLAFIAKRFRRQYQLSAEQQAYVDEWNARFEKLEPKP